MIAAAASLTPSVARGVSASFLRNDLTQLPGLDA